MRGADMHALRRGAGDDAFDVPRLFFLVEPADRDAVYELMSVVDVEHEQPVPAEFQVIANTRHGHIQEPCFDGASLAVA